MVEVKVKQKQYYDEQWNNPLPSYETDGSAGMDVRADIHGMLDVKGVDCILDNQVYTEGGAVIIRPGGRALIPTGLFVSIPEGYEIKVRPRSGLALKHGITVLNTPGCIDSDYRGEIGVILINTDPDNDFVVRHGDRIAQITLEQVSKIQWVPVNSLDETTRGAGGFGHTGSN